MVWCDVCWYIRYECVWRWVWIDHVMGDRRCDVGWCCNLDRLRCKNCVWFEDTLVLMCEVWKGLFGAKMWLCRVLFVVKRWLGEDVIGSGTIFRNYIVTGYHLLMTIAIIVILFLVVWLVMWYSVVWMDGGGWFVGLGEIGVLGVLLSLF